MFRTSTQNSAHRVMILTLVGVLLVFLVGQFGRMAAPAAAAPASPVDETTVPHYFGPYPNWANSQFTLPDVTVAINGDGNGAQATATVGANGAVTGLTLTNPGSGYTSATVGFTGAGTGAAATATVATSGAVTAVTVDTPGSGYTKPTVDFAGGGGSGTMVAVGNPLQARTFATDYAAAPGTLGPVMVVVPTTMPANGTVTSIQYFNQATAGSSPTPSAGSLFHAYVLKATGVANAYTVAWDSGELTVPAAVDPVGVIETIAVPDVAVTTGDTIGFYGQGIPLDDLGTGADILSYPAPTAPVLNGPVTLGGTDFPILTQTRTYSFAATVLDASGVTPLTQAKATAYGSIKTIKLTDAGSGYSFPTVDIDFPDAPDGVQATAHAVCVETNCAPATDGATVTITDVVVDNPGSGYSAAPNVVLRDGTLADPINGGTGATASASLEISSIVVDDPGDGYISAPTVTITDPDGAGATATATVSAGAVTAADPGYRRLGIHHRRGHQEVRRRPARALHAASVPDQRQVHPARRARGEEVRRRRGRRVRHRPRAVPDVVLLEPSRHPRARLRPARDGLQMPV